MLFDIEMVFKWDRGNNSSVAGLHSGLRDIFHFHKMSLSEGRAEYHERPTAGNPRHMVM